MSPRRSLLALLLPSLLLVACGPSESDKSNMKEKMDLDNDQAKIFEANLKDCGALGTESIAFRKKNGTRLKELDSWWVALGKGAKEKLIDNHKSDWDSQTNSLVHATVACPAEVKETFRTY